MSKNVDFSETLSYYKNRTDIRVNERGIKTMTEFITENEKQLIDLIRENDNPENAIMIATAIIIDFLKQHESSEVQAPACLREPS